MNSRLKHFVFSSCQHPVKVYRNGKSFYVNCGKCAPCLKQRGDMLTSRVMREFSDNPFAYFVTLTYDNKHIPLVKYHPSLDRWIPSDQVPCVPVDGVAASGVCSYSYAESQMLPEEFFGESYIPYIKNYPFRDCFGTVSKTDAINFIKRLRTNLNSLLNKIDSLPFDKELKALNKRYGYRPGMSSSSFYAKVRNDKSYKDEKKEIVARKRAVRKSWNSQLFRYFLVSEYGPTHEKGRPSSHRPHYHAILFCQDERVFKMLPCAIRKSWTLCRPRNLIVSPVDSVRACGYVAKYVTGDTSLPRILKTRLTRTFCLSSRCSAIGSLSYSYEKVQEMYASGSIRENYRSYKPDGSFEDFDVRIPKCVLSRYFPKCKGYGSMSRSAKLSVYSRFYYFRSDLSKVKEFFKDVVFYPEYVFDNISGLNVVSRPADFPVSDTLAARACAKWCNHFGVTPDHYLDVMDWFYYKYDMENLEQQFLLSEEHSDVVCDLSFFDDLPECLDPGQCVDECLSYSNTILELRFSPLGTLIRNYTGHDVSYFYDDAGYLDVSRVNEYFEYDKPWYKDYLNGVRDSIVSSNKSKCFNDEFLENCY